MDKNKISKSLIAKIQKMQKTPRGLAEKLPTKKDEVGRVG